MMRRILVVVLLFVTATCAFAVSGTNVMYMGGSGAGFKPGDIGKLDMSPHFVVYPRIGYGQIIHAVEYSLCYGAEITPEPWAY